MPVINNYSRQRELQPDETVVRFLYAFFSNIHKITITKSGFPSQNATRTDDGWPAGAPLQTLLGSLQPSCRLLGNGERMNGRERVIIGGFQGLRGAHPQDVKSRPQSKLLVFMGNVVHANANICLHSLNLH